MARQPLRVLVAPHLPENPYQRLLQSELVKLGVTLSNASVDFDFLTFRKRFRYVRPQILHLHWADKFCLGGSFPSAVWKTIEFLRDLDYVRESGTKIVWTIHNLANHDRKHLMLESALRRYLVENASAFIVHSETAKQAVIESFRPSKKKHLWVLPHGNYIKAYPNRVGRESARAALNIPADRFVFLFLGRIQPYKGVLRLVDAMRSVRELTNATLLVAGDAGNDSYAEKIREGAKLDSRIQLHMQFVANDKIQNFMNAADAVVLPYRRILTSGAAMLAMSFGKAVIAPNLPEMVENIGQDGGIIYDPDQVDGLENALREAVARRTELPAMGARNFETAKQASWDNIAARTLKLYKLLAKKTILTPPSGSTSETGAAH